MTLPAPSQEPPLQRLCVEAGHLPQTQHLATLRRALDGHCEFFPLVSPWSLLGDMVSWRVGGLMFSHWRLNAGHYERSLATAGASGNNWLILRMLRRGRQQLLIDDRHQVTAGTDNILLTDWALPWTCTSSDSDLFILAIPRGRLSASKLMNLKVPALSWERSSPEGKQLAALLALIWEQLPGLGPGEARSVVHGFVGFLDGLLANHPLLLRAQYANTSRLAAMKSVLNERLGDADLGVGTLCEHFGCSRATVYRLFERDGGVAAFIQRQRLILCLRELVRDDSVDPAGLDALARRWCLGGAGRLSQLFQEHFDLTPETVIAAREAERRATRGGTGVQLAAEINRAIAEDSLTEPEEHWQDPAAAATLGL